MKLEQRPCLKFALRRLAERISASLTTVLQLAQFDGDVDSAIIVRREMEVVELQMSDMCSLELA